MNHPNSLSSQSNKDSDDDVPEAPAISPEAMSLLEALQRDSKPEDKTPESETKDEDDDDEEDDESAETTPAVKRSRVGQSLRSLFKRRRNTDAIVPPSVERAPTEPMTEAAAIAGAESLPPLQGAQEIPDELPEPVSSTPNLEPNLEPTPVEIAEEAPVESEPLAPEPLPEPSIPQRAAAANLHTVTSHTPDSQPTPPGSEPEKIIERRGGAGGPLVAFLAANFLSKRRDKKINRNLDKVGDRVEQSEATSKTHAARLNTLDTRQRTESGDQNQRLRSVERALSEPTISSEEHSPEHPTIIPASESKDAVMPAAENKPVAVSEVIAAKAAQAEQADIYFQNEAMRRKARLDAEERANRQPVQELEPAQDETVRESVFERRHEVKDEAQADTSKRTASPLPATTAQGSQFGGSAYNSPAAHAIDSAIVPVNQSVSNSKGDQNDLYSQAMRSGFLVGVTVAVLGILAFVIIT